MHPATVMRVQPDPSHDGRGLLGAKRKRSAVTSPCCDCWGQPEDDEYVNKTAAPC